MKRIFIVFLLLFVSLAYADDQQVGKEQSFQTENVSGSGAAHFSTGNSPATSGNILGATVTREPNALTISGIASAVGTVDTRRVSGDASGTLRISWGGNPDRRRGERSSMAPPGAPELGADLLNGTGLFVVGLGLLLTRKLW